PKGYLHFNQYDQVIAAAIEGHGIALGRMALVFPMLKDGRLVAHAAGRLASSEFAYWLIQANPQPREEVRLLVDWLVKEVARTSRQLVELAEHMGSHENVEAVK